LRLIEKTTRMGLGCTTVASAPLLVLTRFPLVIVAASMRPTIGAVILVRPILICAALNCARWPSLAASAFSVATAVSMVC
jgi:hypothetical protein